jgi:hypothetical protein
MIGKIEKVPLREIWKHEATELTKWLQENPDVISDVVGFQLVNIEREQSTGNFNVDLIAENTSGDSIIIENQLEKSNHDHLGKILTYLTSFDAKIAIWICSDPRPEHIKAISWLNESTDCSFYILKIEGIKIGDSKPAALLTLIVGPSEITKEAGTKKREKSELHENRYKFWEMLIKRSKEKHNLFGSISPSDYTWVGAGAGKSGLQYTFWLTKEDIKIILYIDRGKGSDDENLNILNQLKEKKNEIETIFGSELEWLEMEDKRVSEIRKVYKLGGVNSPEEKWQEIIETATDGMVMFEKALKGPISKLML